MVNYHNFHVECLTWLNTQHVELSGLDGNGSAMCVEVDETYYFHRKYTTFTGSTIMSGDQACWVVERATGRCWLEIIRRCDAPILECIITDHVLPGSIVVT